MKKIIKYISIIIMSIILCGCNKEEIIQNTTYQLELNNTISNYQWKYDISNNNIISIEEGNHDKNKNIYIVKGLSMGSSTIKFSYSDNFDEIKEIHGYTYTFSVDECLNVKFINEEKW